MWAAGDNTEQYWQQGREAQTIGAIMSTWTQKLPDELGVVRERSAAFAEHAWSYRPHPYPQSGVGSFAEFAPRSASADKKLDALIGSLVKNYQCDPDKLQCVPTPVFKNGSAWANGTDYLKDCGSSAPGAGGCCGKACPGPGPGIVYGGRLFVTTGGPNTSFAVGGKTGIAAADAICASQAVVLGLLEADAPAAETARYKALLADEAGCTGKPCRRATVTSGVGDGQIDWPIAKSSAYYLTDNTTLVTVSNSSGLLGVANHSKVGGGNQLSPFGRDWVTLPNRTCNDWRWTIGMSGGPFGVSLGSQGWVRQGFWATAGVPPAVAEPCGHGDFICVEMAAVVLEAFRHG